MYRPALAYVHDRGFGFHADRCAPGILRRLDHVRQQRGTVLEIGCGSGALTRHLTAAGHRVIATDASSAMLDLARGHAPAAEYRRVTLPDDPLPAADAIVSVGHVLNYLPTDEAVRRALAALAAALRPGGVLLIDLCDYRYGDAHSLAPYVRLEPDWAILTRFTRPSRDRVVREITTFTREPDGRWLRDDEVHPNVLVDTAGVPPLLAEHGIEGVIRAAFGNEVLPEGLMAVVAQRPDDEALRSG
jgi:SAM-dependent methyltransferase